MKSFLFLVLLFTSISANAASLTIWTAYHNDEDLHGNIDIDVAGKEIYQTAGGFNYPYYYPNGGEFNGSVSHGYTFSSNTEANVLLYKISDGSPDIDNSSFSASFYDGFSSFSITDTPMLVHLLAGQIYSISIFGNVTNLSQHIGVLVSTVVPIPMAFYLFLPAFLGMIAMRRKIQI